MSKIGQFSDWLNDQSDFVFFGSAIVAAIFVIALCIGLWAALNAAGW